MDNERAWIPIRGFGVRDAPAVVELHIEELVLHGFSPGDRFRISDAVEREMTRLMSERGLPELMNHPANIERLDGGAFRVARGACPQAVGVQLARTLHEGLSPTQKRPLPHRQATKTRTTR